MRIVCATARTAPGVTTATLALASVWPGRVVLVEAASDGGVLAARYRLPAEPGATTLAAATRHDPAGGSLTDHLQSLAGTDGRIRVLLGPPDAGAAASLWRTAAGRIGGLLAAVDDATVVVDAGRLPGEGPVGPLIADADRLLLVARPRVEELQAAAARLAGLREQGLDPCLLQVGDRPYGPDEVAATLGCPVIGVLADDRPAADALAGIGPTRRLGRSRLLRTAGLVADRLAAPAVSASTVSPVPADGGDEPGGWTAAAGRPAPQASR